MKQHQLTKGSLLNQKGELIEAGYHTKLIKTYDKKLVKNSRMRLKEWDYYYVGNKDYGLSITIADNGYMWILSATLLDFKLKTEISKSKMGWFPFKRLGLPQTSEKGNIRVKKGGWEISVTHEKNTRHIEAYIPNFKSKLPLLVDIYLNEMIDDTMVIATPFENRKRFYYNQKINLLQSNGYVQLGEEMLDFKDCYGVLDWGRGAWTYHNIWYWSSLSGMYDSHKVGFNLGYGFGDTSKATENMLFYDDKTYKLEDVEFVIPKENGAYQYLEPWKIISKNQKINLDFKPIIDRNSATNIIILKSIQHQVFGLFSGTITVDDQEIEIKEMIGFAERVENKW
jgi:hypothetical protein